MNTTHPFPSARARIACALFAGGLVLSACGGDDPTELDGVCDSRLPGDLVISEFMGDPEGDDIGLEWIELFNASGSDIDLAGMTLYNADANGGGEKKHTFKSVTVPAGGYLVVGDVRGNALPAWVQYSYGSSLGAIRNTAGTLGLRCGGKLLDETKYTKTLAAGRSRQLTGDVAPDAVLNDQEINWCSAETQPKYDGTNAGTPGAPNQACGDTSSGNCVDPVTKQSRPISYPTQGSLILTEIMPDPAAVSDTDGEWVEVYARSDVDLNGITLAAGSSRSTVKATECLPLKGGQYAVLARSNDPAKNGGLPVVHATYGTTLPNSNSTLTMLAGTTTLDEVSWTTVKSGASLQLSSDKFAPGDNTSTAFCASTKSYGGGDQGTPGEANDVCGAVIPNQCTGRNPGDLVITEFMANPGGTDSGKEWIEIYNATGAAIDLEGLSLRYSRADGSSAKSVTLSAALVPSKKYFTLGDAPATELPAHIDYGYGSAITLGNTDGNISLYCGTTLVDEIIYTRVKDNASRSFDGSLAPDALANDDEGAWCDASVMSGDFFGTPRNANAACGSGTAGCVDGTTGQLRNRMAPGVGRLIVTEVMASPDGTDSDREWFELYAFDDMDLNGVIISRDTPTSSTRVTLNREECITVRAGNYAVLARKATPEINGGIASPVATFNFSLPNAATLVVSLDGTVLDLARYPTGPAGASQELSADRLTAFVNDSPYAWCAGTPSYGAGGKGTPGSANGVCPSPVAPGECRDTVSGQPRTIVRPVAGQLVVTEVMAQPTMLPGASNERPREWFEVVSTGTVDLNEVEVANELGSSFTVSQAACFALNPGTHVLFAQSANAALNGGLPAPDFVFDFDLANTGTGANPERAIVVRSQGTELDRYPYATSTLGASDQLSGAVTPTPAANDVTTNRCAAPASATYGDGNRGTPRAQNPVCP